MTHTCLITGITGQTGAYLAACLLAAGQKVEGTSRTSSPNLWRLKHLGCEDRVTVSTLSGTDPAQIDEIASRRYDRIYHLAAESSVAASLQNPRETVQANLYQTTCWLTSLRDHSPQTRFFNAVSSEILRAKPGLLNETSERLATNPYAVTKSAAMEMARVFRESFGLYIVNGILFNHESELRDARFVTGKIVANLCRMADDPNAPAFELGNTDAQRDFSHAEDFARGIAAGLEAETAQDYIFASGRLSSVKDFFNIAARRLGFVPEWSGEGVDRICIDSISGRILASINPQYYRPVDELSKAGDASRAKSDLSWNPKIKFDEMVGRMVAFHSQTGR